MILVDYAEKKGKEKLTQRPARISVDSEGQPVLEMYVLEEGKIRVFDKNNWFGAHVEVFGFDYEEEMDFWDDVLTLWRTGKWPDNRTWLQKIVDKLR
jgi:hypothetical protein